MPSLHAGSEAGSLVPEGAPALDTRRRRALFRAWHRGTREMDLVMGRFADREMATLSETELELFEHLLELPESEVYGWISGQHEAPADIDPSFLTRLGTFRAPS